MLDIDKHKIVLLQILKDIYNDITIAPILGFKGGTACYLFYNLTRFSVDLDFDLLDIKKGISVFEKINYTLKNYGTIKEKFNKPNTFFFLLSYQTKLQNIKIEISKRNYGSGYEIKNYLGIPLFVMKKEDIFSNKLVTLLERKKTANRDLFDLWFFLKNNWDFNPALIENRTKQTVKIYLNQCMDYVKKINEKYLLTGIGELIDTSTKLWIKKNLKKDLLFLLQLRAENIKM